MARNNRDKVRKPNISYQRKSRKRRGKQIWSNMQILKRAKLDSQNSNLLDESRFSGQSVMFDSIDSNITVVPSSSVVNIGQPVKLSESRGNNSTNSEDYNINPQSSCFDVVDNDIPSKSASNEFALHGRRIVDIKQFFDSIINFKHHNLFSCGTEHVRITGEQQIGLCSKFFMECHVCKERAVIYTDEKESNKMGINEAATLGTISTGGGYSQLDEFLAFCDIPSMSFPTFNATQNKIAPYIHNTAFALMEEAGKEEAQLARELGEVDIDGIPKITVIADGAWCKRSYKSNYNASSGVGVIIGQRTKKILYLGIKNKYCFICTKAENKKEKAAPHTCFKNWNKTSTAMESEIILEGFKSSIEMHGVKYAYLIGDGDSSVTRKLAEIQPYGNNLLVHKIECRNHLLRNFCTNLKELTTKRVSSKRQLVSYQQREMLKKNIQRFRVAVQCAVKHWLKENISHEEKVPKLRKDILNSVNHVFGEHTECAEYFCKKKENTEPSYIRDITESGLFQDILVLLNRLSRNADSLLLDMDNNAAECYNSIVAKFVGGKRINFSGRNSYQVRCEAASVSCNVGASEYPRILHKAIKQSSPGQFTKKYSHKKHMAQKWRQAQRTLFPQKFKKTVKKTANVDSDYGPDAANISQDLPEDYNERKDNFLKTLPKSYEEIDTLQKKTIGQNSNRLWKEARMKRLTASKFGNVCKMRRTTHCSNIIKSMLYSTFRGNADTSWGNDHEPLAIAEFEKHTKMKVSSCGLFVDVDHPFLAASPDGLVESDAILEIKCPHKCAGISPTDAILNKKITFATLENGSLSLKKNSNYYYQVQGQLHITRRAYCYFVVWSPLGMEIEKIHKDDGFWKNKMETSLIEFFHNCLLPEIIDPMFPKGLPIRDLRGRIQSNASKK